MTLYTCKIEVNMEAIPRRRDSRQGAHKDTHLYNDNNTAAARCLLLSRSKFNEHVGIHLLDFMKIFVHCLHSRLNGKETELEWCFDDVGRGGA